MSDKQPVGIRRIVTGHDEGGTAVIIEDGPTPGVKPRFDCDRAVV